MLQKRFKFHDYKQWYPELRQNVPGVPIVFVGSKVDLRDEGIKCIT